LIENARAEGDEQSEAYALIHLSFVADALGDRDESGSTLARVRRVGRNEPLEFFFARKLIDGYLSGGAHEHAGLALRWALEEVATDPTNRCALLADDQWVKRALGRHEEADLALDALEAEIARLREAEPARVSALEVLETRLAVGRANGWMSLGVLNRAASDLEAALASAERSGDSNTLLTAAMAYSDLCLLQQRWAIGLDVLDRVLDEHGDRLPPPVAAVARLQRGVVLSEMARADVEVRAPAEAALRAFLEDPAGRVDLATRGRLELADLLLRAGGDAARHLAVGAMLDEAEEGLDGRSGTESMAVAASIRARWVLAGDLPDDALQLGLAKARAGLAGMIAEWRTAPRRPGGVGFLKVSYRRELIAAVVDLTLALDPSTVGKERALDTLLGAQGEGALVADLGGGAVDLAQLRARFLGERHGCLVFLPGRTGTHLFAFDRERVVHDRLSALVELDPLLDSFERSLFAAPARRERGPEALLAALERDAARLASELIGPEVRGLLTSWESVTVVGSELLGRLPLECLPLGPEGELLGLTHAVDGVPSLALAARLSELGAADRGVAQPALLFVGDLNPADPTAEMEVVAADELRAAVRPLLDPFERERREVLIGAGSDWDKVAAALRARGPVGVLHFLAHGAYDADRERGACLALASRVFADDVEALERTGRLVILSACGAARGPERHGSDNLAHLGGAFLRAGARCVILTRADVLLGRTLSLDRELHEQLASGVAAAEALRRARVVAAGDDALGAFLACRFQAYGLGSERPLGDQ
jgi:tetratricopeptide (TPR) repeat protein